MGLLLSFALLGGCKSSTVSDMRSGAQGEACNQGCDSAETECNDKCKQQADKTACELACKVTRDKCADDCKKK